MHQLRKTLHNLRVSRNSRVNGEKKDGKLERFNVNKIILGSQKACEKKPVTVTQINELVGQVRQELMIKGTEEVASREIGDLIMKYLKNVNRIAYIRFVQFTSSLKDLKISGGYLLR